MTGRTDLFSWRGRDRYGHETAGEMSATSAGHVRRELAGRGIRATSVRRQGGGGGRQGGGRGRGRLRSGDIAVLARQLAALTRAGVPVLQAFGIVADGTDRLALARLVRAIQADVSAGDSVASALGRRPECFDQLFCHLVEAGERSGTLPAMLDRLATYGEQAEGLRRKVKKALTYPAAVLCVAAVVSGILLVKVVPQFEQIFAGFGAELPASTLLVIELSEFARDWWLTVVGSGVGVVLGLRTMRRRSPALGALTDRLSLRLPVVGGLARRSSVARCARTLSTTFAAGVPLVDALDSVADAAGNRVFEAAVRRVRAEVAAGRQLHVAMRDAGVFPDDLIGMVAVGEESGTLDDMLARSAAWYERQVDDAVDTIASMVEPTIMAVLGVLVGGLIVAMYLPIFQLGAVMG